MDQRRFDALARALSGASTRRAALAGALVALLPLAGAAKRGRRAAGYGGPGGPTAKACLAVGQRCGKGSGKRGKPCAKCCSRFSIAQPNGRKRCACKPAGAAARNAAQCCSGHRSAGVCGACEPGLTDCNGGCVNTRTDDAHCGACANACASGQRCAVGACACDAKTCPDGCCAMNTCVPVGEACGPSTVCLAGGSCAACGGAGQPCCAGDACAAGGCCQPDGTCAASGAACAAATNGICCGGSCVRGDQSPNCGACGAACADTGSCACQSIAPAGFACALISGLNTECYNQPCPPGLFCMDMPLGPMCQAIECGDDPGVCPEGSACGMSICLPLCPA